MSSMNAYPNFDDATSRGPSQGLWGLAPHNMNQLLDNPSLGHFLWDDFLTFTSAASGITSDWVGTLVGTTPTIVLSAQGDTGYLKGGQLKMSTIGTNAGDGINLQKPGSAFIAAANTTIIMEVGFKVQTAATQTSAFIGLGTVDTTCITSSNALAIGATTTANHIGFQSLTGDGIYLFGAGKAATATTKTSNTITAGTVVKMGFKIKGVTRADQYINGVLTSPTTPILTANIPITGLTPTIVIQNQTTVAQIAFIDWIRVAQFDGEF